MAMDTVKQNEVSRAAQTARALLNLKEQIDEIDYMWGTGGLSTAITQADLDTIASFSGLTTTQLADALYAIGVIKGQLAASLGQLIVLAIRS